MGYQTKCNKTVFSPNLLPCVNPSLSNYLSVVKVADTRKRCLVIATVLRDRDENVENSWPVVCTLRNFPFMHFA